MYLHNPLVALHCLQQSAGLTKSKLAAAKAVEQVKKPKCICIDISPRGPTT